MKHFHNFVVFRSIVDRQNDFEIKKQYEQWTKLDSKFPNIR